MQLKAIQSFSSGLEGSVTMGTEFQAEPDRAQELIDGGYAVSTEPVEEEVKVTRKK